MQRTSISPGESGGPIPNESPRQGEDRRDWSRREWLAHSAGGLILLALPLPLRALPENTRALLRRTYGDAEIRFERIELSLPALAENGNSVAFGVTVERSPADTNGVLGLDVLAPENPNPRIARLTFGPACGKAAARTRIRMAASQTVVAVARFANGDFFGGAAEIVVTEAACLDFLI